MTKPNGARLTCAWIHEVFCLSPGVEPGPHLQGTNDNVCKLHHFCIQMVSRTMHTACNFRQHVLRTQQKEHCARSLCNCPNPSLCPPNLHQCWMHFSRPT